MDEKIVAKKKKKLKKRKKRPIKKVVLTTKVAVGDPVSYPGKTERALMFLVKTLKFLLAVLGKKINKLKAARLADRMDKK